MAVLRTDVPPVSSVPSDVSIYLGARLNAAVVGQFPDGTASHPSQRGIPTARLKAGVPKRVPKDVGMPDPAQTGGCYLAITPSNS